METFQEFSERWRTTILPMKKRASQHTMSSHIKLLNSKIGGCPLPDISYAQLQQVFSDLAKEQMPRSCRNVFGTLRNLLGQAKREGLIKEFPTPILPKIRKSQQDWLPHESMKKIISAAGDHKPFVALMCETGLRIGEALGLQTQDIDFNERTLSVNRSVFGGRSQEPKTSTAYRSFTISKELSDLLRGQCLQGQAEAYVFRTRSGGPQWVTEIRARVLDPLMRAQGLEPIGFHGLRRGNATFFASVVGMPERILAQRLGHACKSMTLGTYAMTVDKADVPYVQKAVELLYALE
jgi:integrase